MAHTLMTMTEKADRAIELPAEVIIRETKSTILNIQIDNIYETRAAYQKTIADKDRPLVSILVFGYNNLQKHTKYCVESILKYTTAIDYELVLLDNGSSDGTLEYFKSVPYKKKKMVRITNNKGGNFGVYLGTQYLTGRYAVMIANDVYVTKNWLSNMIKCAESDERIGFVATASDNISNLQAVNLTFDSLEEMQLKAERYNVSDPHKWEERLRLMPAIALFKRECLDIVGSLDYVFQHDFSDDDISVRVRRAGYKIVFCGDVFVHHVGPTATGSNSGKKIELLKTGRDIFRQKYFGVDAWEDINNFELLMLSLVNPEEKRGTLKPEVLGIDVMCGTPILQLKNKLRLADIFDTNLSAFVQDAKYWLDLKTICDGTVAVDRIEYLTEHFSPNSFDYILLGNPINLYKDTDKILIDILSLMKSEGQLLIKLKNHFDAKAFLGSSGKDPGGANKTVTYSDINNLNDLLMRNGYAIRDVRQKLHAIDDATKEAIRSVLKSSRGAQNIDTIFNELLTEEYALRIMGNIVHQVKPLVDKPYTIQSTSSNIEITMPNESQQHSNAVMSETDPLFLHVRQEIAVPGMTSIVIPTCDRLDYTKKCVKSIRKHTPEPHEIIFVDNGSTDGTVKWLHGQVKENKNYRLIENKENVGFTKGCNQGIHLSQGEFILLLDNDVIVSNGWLSGMMECHKHEPDAGVVGPMTNDANGPQRIVDDDYRNADYLDKFAARFREMYHRRRIPNRKIDRFCMLFHRTLVEKIGLLDERFGAEQCVEEDFFLRATLVGHRNCIAGDVFIHHYGDRCFPNQERKADRKIIERKWALSLQSPDGKRLAVLKATELANDLYQHGKTDKAVEALIDCIKITPGALDIYDGLARIFIETKRFSEAWEVIESMPEKVRNSLKGLECAGYTKEGLGLDSEAAAYTDRILSLDDQYAPALNLRGVLAYKKGDGQTAEDAFAQAIDADPGYGEVWTNIGVLKWGTEKKDEAVEDLKMGFVLAPLVPDHSSIYYSAIASAGRFAEAEAAFRDARRLYPNSKKIAFLYIDALVQQGKWDTAMLEIEDALVAFGLEEGMLDAALSVREHLGPRKINKDGAKKGTLSLCMIVKNEEEQLVKCLRSVRDIADEMIVVDTGSTDKTMDLARVFGAQVFEFSWTGNFSEARNHSLAKAVGDWIFVLDADEVLSPIDFKQLKEIIRKKSSSPVAYSIVTRNYINNVSTLGWTANKGEYPEEAGRGWLPSPKVRLFTRRENVYFSDPVHETVEASVTKANIPIESCGIVVHHYGKLSGELDLKKGENYYLLGRIKLETDPTNCNHIQELARQAQALGRYEECIDLSLKLIELAKTNPQAKAYMNIIHPLKMNPATEAYIHIASSYLALERYEEALSASQRAMAIGPKIKEVIQTYANCEIIGGSVDKAYTALHGLLMTEPDYPPALLLLAIIFCLKGKVEMMQNLFKLLLSRAFNITPGLNKMAKQLYSRGKTNEAMLILQTMIENRLKDQETMSIYDALINS